MSNRIKKWYQTSIHILIVFVFINLGYGQNLIPNGDFEVYLNCPQDQNEISNVNNWFNPFPELSPDYFNSCNNIMCTVGIPSNAQSDSLEAMSGKAYVGLLTVATVQGVPLEDFNPREYISIKLVESLEDNQEYEISFYSALSKNSKTATELHFHFSEKQLETEEISEFLTASTVDLLQDTSWTFNKVRFTGKEQYKYLTIGNFSSADDYKISSVENRFSSCIFPLGLGEFYTYYFIDDIQLKKLNPSNDKSKETSNSIDIFPNPIQNYLNIKFTNYYKKSSKQVKIFDFLGRQIMEHKSQLNNIILKPNLNSGIYIIQISIDNELKIIKRINSSR